MIEGSADGLVETTLRRPLLLSAAFDHADHTYMAKLIFVSNQNRLTESS